MVMKRGANPLKRKNFAESAADAAREAVETVTVQEGGKRQRRRVTFDGVDSLANASIGESESRLKTEAVVAAKRAAVGGIVEAKKMPCKKAFQAAAKRKGGKGEADDHSDDDDDDDDAGSGEEQMESDSDDNLSSLAGDGDDDDDDDDASETEGLEENPFKKARRDGTRLSYRVLRLRFLPPEFQEPQLFKFLSQFGERVLNCFCVRSRRTHQSKGIAYVQFSSETVLPTVVEECHGMSLGGRALQARCVTLHRPMPTKEKVSRRRQLAYTYKTCGAPLQRHDLRYKNPVASLIRYARAEEVNNAHLKRLGIDYECHDFAKQLANVPAGLIIRKRRGKKRERSSHRSSRSCRLRLAERHSVGKGEGDGETEADGNENGVESTVVTSLSMSSTDAAAAASAVRDVKRRRSKRNNDNAAVTTATAKNGNKNSSDNNDNNNNIKGDNIVCKATSAARVAVPPAVKGRGKAVTKKPARAIGIGA